MDGFSRSDTESSVLENKAVAILGVTVGSWGTGLAQTHLRHVLADCSMLTMHQPSLYIAEAKNLFSENGKIRNKEKSKALQYFLLIFEQWIKKISNYQ